MNSRKKKEEKKIQRLEQDLRSMKQQQQQILALLQNLSATSAASANSTAPAPNPGNTKETNGDSSDNKSKDNNSDERRSGSDSENEGGDPDDNFDVNRNQSSNLKEADDVQKLKLESRKRKGDSAAEDKTKTANKVESKTGEEENAKKKKSKVDYSSSDDDRSDSSWSSDESLDKNIMSPLGKTKTSLKGRDQTLQVQIAAGSQPTFQPLPKAPLTIQRITELRDKVGRLNGQTLSLIRRKALFPVAVRESMISRVKECVEKDKPGVRGILKGRDPDTLFRLKNNTFFRLLVACYQPPGIKDASEVIYTIENEIASLPLELFGKERNELDQFVIDMKEVGIAHGLKDGKDLFNMFPEAKAKNLLKGLTDRFKTNPKDDNRLYQGLYRDLTGDDRPKDLESWTERALSK